MCAPTIAQAFLFRYLVLMPARPAVRDCCLYLGIDGHVRPMLTKSWASSCLLRKKTSDDADDDADADAGAAVKESLATLAEGLKQTDSLTRFHPLRKLTESMVGESIGFALQFPFQGELARNMYCAVLGLCNCAATQLIAAQIRVDRGQRSSLANAIAKHGASC